MLFNVNSERSATVVSFSAFFTIIREPPGVKLPVPCKATAATEMLSAFFTLVHFLSFLSVYLLIFQKKYIVNG